MPLFGGFAQARNFGKGGAGRPPGFITASGSSLGTLRGGGGSDGLLSAAATTGPGDPPITGYSIVSGSLPPGLSFNTSTGDITGTPNVVSSNTTSTFTVRASSPSGNVDATFSITIRPAILATWTSQQSTNWSVPSGVTEVEILMIAPGGSGGHIGGGGGAGGIVYTNSFPVTPGSTVPIFIGAPGGPFYGSYPRGNTGQDSNFGTLVAKGGGYGGSYDGTGRTGGAGGSGGGGAHSPSHGGGSSIQPTANPGVAGLTNYGNSGGSGAYPVSHQGAGGGGAGSNGTGWQQGYPYGGSGAYFSEYTSYGTPGGHFAAGGGGGGWSGHIYGPGSGGTGGGGNGGYNGNGTNGSGHGSGGGAGGYPAPSGTYGSPGAIFIKY